MSMDPHDLLKDPDNPTSFNNRPERLGRRGLILTIVGYFIVVSFIIVLPFYLKIMAPGRHTILQVGERIFTTRDLIKRMRLKPPDPGTNQLEWATNVLQEIQNQELIRQEAVKQKISVSEQELEQEIRRRIMGSASGEVKFEDLYLSMLGRLRLKEEEYKTWIKSDIYQGKLFQRFLDKVPATAEQVRIYAIVTNTAMKAEAIKARLKKGDDFSKVVTEASIDIESYKKGGELGWIPKGVDELMTSGQILAMGILTKTKTEAEQIREKILSGRNFGELVRNHSLDKESRDEGGSLGWVSADIREGKSYASEAYELNPGEVSRPIQTQEGFWIIKLIEKTPRGKLIDDIAFQLPIGQASPPLNTIKGFYLLKITAREQQRPLSEEHRGRMANKAFMEWLADTAKRGAKEGWIRWDWGSETYNWVINHLN